MGLSYNDLTLLRYIQKRQNTPLAKVSLHFGKNETSIRRTIEQINLYSPTPLIEIRKSRCISRVSYKKFVEFIQNISLDDYATSYSERIRVMIVMIFFQGYVNASSLYEQWGFSLTTKKQDTAHLRQFLTEHGLTLVTLKKKGLAIEGDELQFRFLIINILHPLLEFTSDDQIQARLANTPLERQCYDLASADLLVAADQAADLLNHFLTEHNLSLNYPSKKFMLLFICIMQTRPLHTSMSFSYRLPFASLNMDFDSDIQTNRLYNVALSMMNFSHSPDYPSDPGLRHIVEVFASNIVNELEQPFSIQEEFLDELYNYFYREITLDHFHCTFVDKTVENTREQFADLYGIIHKHLVMFKASYNFHFMDEHISTLTLLLQKHILRNQIVSRSYKRIVIVTSINFERISFFQEQVREYVTVQWLKTLNINEIHELANLDYDYIFCFSARIYNILQAQNLPVIRMNFFVTQNDIDNLLHLGFIPLKHRFLASSFVLEIAGKNEHELVEYLKERYGEYFI